MPKLHDLTGQKFNRLTVINRDNSSKKRSKWFCKCDCGKVLENSVPSDSIISGKRKSCGCLRREKIIDKFTKHGKTKSKEYRIWQNIKNRCYNKNVKCYSGYGGRGIYLYDEWIDDFEKFYDYISSLDNFKNKDYTLDRIDNNLSYIPNNLRWTSPRSQARNRRNNKFSIETAREVRDLYFNYGISIYKLAKQYGVAKYSIFSIIHNLTWKE